nr:sugar ABC transporter permease [Natronoglycomyces albus]
MNTSQLVSKLTMLGLGLAAFILVIVVLLALAELVAKRGSKALTAAVFLAPVGLLLGAGLVVPAARTLGLSMFDGSGENFVWFANFQWIFTDSGAQIILLNTLLWVVLTPLIATGIGLLYAVLIDGKRGEAIYKSLVFMPMAISFVGAAVIWRFIYDHRGGTDQIGLLNQVVVWLGGEPQAWLQMWPWNTLLLIVVLIWVQTGFATVVLSAALKGIPAEIQEAARIDGATPWQEFWRVTIPSIRPAIIVVVVTISIASLKLFDIVRTMTGGQFRTGVVADSMWFQAFRLGEAGRGAALAVVLFIMVIPIVAYQVHNLKRRQEETR